VIGDELQDLLERWRRLTHRNPRGKIRPVPIEMGDSPLLSFQARNASLISSSDIGSLAAGCRELTEARQPRDRSKVPDTDGAATCNESHPTRAGAD